MSSKILISLLIIFLFAVGCTGNPTQDEETMKIFRSEAGGYEFRPLKGYEIKEFEGTVSMFPPNGDPLSGPGMVMEIIILDRPIGLEKAMEVAEKTSPQYTFTGTKKIQINDYEAVTMDFTTVYQTPDGVIPEYQGAAEGEKLNGRIILVMVSPTRQFKGTMLAPASKWKEVLPIFEEVVESLTFREK